jgi:RHS repeat-associated protein
VGARGQRTRNLAEDYNYFRDYDPSIGRYVESDPMGLEADLNTYSYVVSSPLTLADPLGLEPGGPYHSPASTRCSRFNTCAAIRGKMHELERMINSHQGWDWHNPPPRGGGRHATEIGELWRAYARCQEIYAQKKCKDDGGGGMTCGENCQKTLVAIRDAVTGAIVILSVCIAAATAP